MRSVDSVATALALSLVTRYHSAIASSSMRAADANHQLAARRTPWCAEGLCPAPRHGGLLSMMGIARTAFRRVHVIAASVPLCGCERVPSINVLGAYFPSWMLCFLVGVALTLVVRLVLVAAGLEPWIGPGLVYPALALAITLAWVTFFRG
jgi:hypothetical protein